MVWKMSLLTEYMEVLYNMISKVAIDRDIKWDMEVLTSDLEALDIDEAHVVDRNT